LQASARGEQSLCMLLASQLLPAHLSALRAWTAAPSAGMSLVAAHTPWGQACRAALLSAAQDAAGLLLFALSTGASSTLHTSVAGAGSGTPLTGRGPPLASPSRHSPFGPSGTTSTKAASITGSGAAGGVELAAAVVGTLVSWAAGSAALVGAPRMEPAVRGVAGVRR
jgi:hypothetical protein